MGYKVYAGTLKVSNMNVHSTLGYFSWVEKRLIFSTDAGAIGMASDEPLLLEPKLTLSANDPGSLTFRVPERIFDSGGLSFENPMHGLLELGHVFVSVEEDDVTIFMGYIKSISKNFDLTQEVEVVGVMDLLNYNPILWLPREWRLIPTTPALFIDGIIGHGLNSGVFFSPDGSGTSKMPITFDPDSYDVTDKNKTVDTTDDGYQYMSFMECVQKYMLDEYGGYFRVDVDTVGDNQYRFVIRYTKDSKVTTQQTVEYGKNLLDMNITTDVSGITNQVVVVNHTTKTKGWWIFKTTVTETFSGVAREQESINKYGLHEVVLTTDTAETNEKCTELAKEELAKRECYPIPELEASACDRVDAGVKTDRLGFLKKSRVISKPHDVDGVYLCTKEVIPLDDMTGKQFTFGLPPVKLSKMQNQLEAAQAATRNVTRGIVSAMNSTNTASATAT